MSQEENEKTMIALLKEISSKLDSSSKETDEAAEKKAAEIKKAYEEEYKALERVNDQLGVTQERNNEILRLKLKAGAIDREEYELAVAMNQEMAKGLEIADGMANEFDSLFKTITGITDNWKNSAFGKLMQPGGFSALQQSFRKTFTSANILGSSIEKLQEKTIELALAQDKALAGFNRTTGASRIYGDQIIALEREMFIYGITSQDAADSMAALTTEVFNFDKLSSVQQNSMVRTVGILNELGVDASVTAGNIQEMTSVMGISANAAAAYSREMFALAQDIRMPPEEMAMAFKSASPFLSRFGDDAVDVFKDLQVAARQANMEVSEVISIVEQFDTFEGAADSVGKLNAVLGGPFLSSLEMVKATDPVERMTLLSDAINSAGKSFQDMGYYEKLTIANAAGLSDVSELAKVMAGDFEGVAGITNKTSAEMEALQAQQKEFNDLASEASQIAMGFAISMRPVIEAVKSLMQGFQELNHQMGGLLIPGLAIVTAGLAGLVGLTTIMTAKSVAMTAAEAAKGLAILGSASAQATATPIMITAGAAAGAAAPPMYTFAGAALAVGAAFFLVGAGIGIAAAGMSLFMESMSLIPVKDMFMYGLGLYTIAGGMAALVGATMFGGGFGLGLLVASTTALGLALSSIDQSKLSDLAMLFSAIAVVMQSSAENLKAVESTVTGVIKSIKSIEPTTMGQIVEVRQLIQAASGQAPAAPNSTSTAAPAATPQPVIINLDFMGQRVMESLVGHLVKNKFHPLGG